MKRFTAIHASSSWARTSGATAARTRSAKVCSRSSGRIASATRRSRSPTFVGAGIGAALGGAAADRRGDDGQFQPAGARSDRQQRGHHPAHVGRAVQRAGGHPYGDGRGTSTRRAARAQPRRLVRTHSRVCASSRRRRSKTRVACCGRRSQDPDPVLIFEHQTAVQHGRRRWPRRGRRRYRSRGGAARGRRRDA